MIKKIILGIVLVGTVGFLVFGAVNRTLAKTSDSQLLANGTGNGGRNQSLALNETHTNDSKNPIQLNQQLNRSEVNTSYGNGNNRKGNSLQENSTASNGQNRQGENQTGIPDPQATVGDLANYEGTVSNVDVDLIIVEATDGTEILIEGRALSYLQEIGFTTQVGASYDITGFYEDGEYKIITIEDQSTNEIFIVRDASGRPGWAGNGWGGNSSSKL